MYRNQPLGGDQDLREVSDSSTGKRREDENKNAETIFRHYLFFPSETTINRV